MLLPWLEAGLFSHHAWALHLVNIALTVGDHPMTADQLHHSVALIGNGDVVCENVLRSLGNGFALKVFRHGLDFDSLGDGIVHGRRLSHAAVLRNSMRATA